MKPLAFLLLLLCLATKTFSACVTLGQNPRPCLTKSQRSARQQALVSFFAGLAKVSPDDPCFKLREGGNWVCLYDTDPGKYNFYKSCTCGSSSEESVLPESSSSGSSTDGECMSGSKKCLGASEVPSAYFNLFWNGNGSPCYSDRGNWCVTSVSPSGGISMGSCSCSVTKCGCGTRPADICPPGLKPDHECDAAKLREYRAEYGDDHSVGSEQTCGRYAAACGTVCDSGRLTQDEREEILRVHNDLRSRVARGLEKRSLKGGSQPRAKDMNQLIWDDELATIAQRFADTCTGSHDTNSQRKALTMTGFVGQNAFFSSGLDRNFTQAIREWYNEVKDYPADKVSNFQTSNGNGAVIGHYTAVVWGKTTRVGCGITSYDPSGNKAFNQRIMCNYWPAANLRGAALYTEAADDSEIGAECANKDVTSGLCKPESTL